MCYRLYSGKEKSLGTAHGVNEKDMCVKLKSLKKRQLIKCRGFHIVFYRYMANASLT